MASVTTARLTDSAGTVPVRLSLPAAANKLFPKGTIVQIDGSGNAVPGAAGNGLLAVGVAAATFDNRTGSEAGGLAGDLTVEIECGIHAFDVDGTLRPGATCWVLDNHTVSDDSDTGTNGVAGVVHEVQTVRGRTQAYVWMAPEIAELFSDDSALSSAVTTAQADIDDLQADALTTQYVIPVPLNSFRMYADGSALIPFVGGTSDGIDPTAESGGFRWNDDSTAAISASVLLPNDYDDSAAAVVHVLGYRVGAADATAALTVGAFFRVAGAAFNADADAGGDTSAFAAATTVLSEVTRTIVAGDTLAAPCSLLLTLTPTAALDDDDLVILEVWLEVTRKLLTS